MLEIRPMLRTLVLAAIVTAAAAEAARADAAVIRVDGAHIGPSGWVQLIVYVPPAVPAAANVPAGQVKLDSLAVSCGQKSPRAMARALVDGINGNAPAAGYSVFRFGRYIFVFTPGAAICRINAIDVPGADLPPDVNNVCDNTNGNERNAHAAGWSFRKIIIVQQNRNHTDVTAGNSVSCNVNGMHLDNSYWRTYSLAAQGVTQAIDLTAVLLAIESAISPAGVQPVTLRLYLDPTPGDIMPVSGLQLLHSETIAVADQAGTVLVHPLSRPINVPIVSGTEQLVVEVFTPDGTGAGNSLFIGSNSDVDGGATYLSAPGCGIAEPTTVASLGFPSMHMIQAVAYVPAGEVASGFPGTGDDFRLQSSIDGAAFESGAGLDVIGVAPGDLVTLRLDSPLGASEGRPFFLLGEIFAPAQPPAPPFPGIAVSGNPQTTFIMGGGAAGAFGVVLPVPGYLLSFYWPQLPAALLVQGLSVDPAAANGIFASTHAQAFVGS